MAKKVLNLIKHIHRDCEHCHIVDYEFISISGKPIMGECIYNPHRFMLNESCEECKMYKQV